MQMYIQGKKDLKTPVSTLPIADVGVKTQPVKTNLLTKIKDLLRGR